MEIIVIDDASSDGSCERINVTAPRLAIKIVRLSDRHGVPKARNAGAAAATAPILFMTDAHVRLSDHWDSCILDNIRATRVLAATIADPTSAFRGYGCSLALPFMGTEWNKTALRTGDTVQIPSCAGTVLTRQLFESIGGYDEGMITYGFAEPEFGVRSWLSDAEIVSLPDLIVWHRFKAAAEISSFLQGLRPLMLHNALRFGFLYLGYLARQQMIRWYAEELPDQMPTALRLIRNSDVWDRREQLDSSLRYDFKWFVERFSLKDHLGQEIPF